MAESHEPISDSAADEQKGFAAIDVHEVPRKPLIFNPNFKFSDPPKPAVRRFFNNTGKPWWTWPDPIDNTLVRLTSFFVLLAALSIIATTQECKRRYEHSDPPHKKKCTEGGWYLVFVLLYDFAVRTMFGPTPFSPFGLMATGILFALRVPPNLVPSSAKRFSFFLGILVSSVMTILFWIVGTTGTREFASRPLIVLCVFAGLESIGGFCVGCWFFQTFFKLRDKWNLRSDYAKLQVPTNCAKKWFNPLVDNAPEKHNYDVDLLIIGAGSGGLAAAKEAARLGKKVVLLDYVKPSPHGSTWGVGGTCVNVGCIPKKLFHQAAIIGHLMKHDAYYFGWSLRGHSSFPKPHDFDISWKRCRDNVQEHIRVLNEGYDTGLAAAHVQYINAFGTFIDAHTVRATSADGSHHDITANRIVIAVGGRPRYDKIPGAELAITSDDIFSMEKPPGKTLVIGASYIALECGGFLAGLGFDVTIMARSKCLRGFDQDMACRIVENMEVEGTKIMTGFAPTRFMREADGTIRAFWRKTNEDGCVVDAHDGAECSDVFDTVLSAIGRIPNTAALGLDKIGVKTAPNGKIYHYNERTTVPHIYAIGDVCEPGVELTPVAIKQGLLLMQRLYNGSTTLFNFQNYPTTVFTPLEYGCIGVSEEKAIEVFGEDNIEVYHSEFTPLEHYVPHTKYRCYCKVIVTYLDHERVIGFHYLGPNAGEVTQGYTAAFVAGLKKKELDAIIGIHPTSAEEMVTLRRSKRSGMDPKKTGC